VFVGNLSYDVTREELLEVFGAAGKVVDAKVPTDRDTGRPRGFAFVEFDSDEAAARSIELLNGKDLRGRPLRVNEADNRPPRPGGPGGERPSFRPSFGSEGPRGRGGLGGDRPGRGRPFVRGDEVAFPPPEQQDRRGRGRGAPKTFKEKAGEGRGGPKPKPNPKKRPKSGNWEDWDDYYDE
jgi:RNA recognition motif-containing protein